MLSETPGCPVWLPKDTFPCQLSPPHGPGPGAVARPKAIAGSCHLSPFPLPPDSPIHRPTRPSLPSRPHGSHVSFYRSVCLLSNNCTDSTTSSLQISSWLWGNSNHLWPMGPLGLWPGLLSEASGLWDLSPPFYPRPTGEVPGTPLPRRPLSLFDSLSLIPLGKGKKVGLGRGDADSK